MFPLGSSNKLYTLWNNPPDDSLGEDGDIAVQFFNFSERKLVYGPKSGGKWGKGEPLEATMRNANMDNAYNSQTNAYNSQTNANMQALASQGKQAGSVLGSKQSKLDEELTALGHVANRADILIENLCNRLERLADDEPALDLGNPAAAPMPSSIAGAIAHHRGTLTSVLDRLQDLLDRLHV